MNLISVKNIYISQKYIRIRLANNFRLNQQYINYCKWLIGSSSLTIIVCFNANIKQGKRHYCTQTDCDLARYFAVFVAFEHFSTSLRYSRPPPYNKKWFHLLMLFTSLSRNRLNCMWFGEIIACWTFHGNMERPIEFVWKYNIFRVFVTEKELSKAFANTYVLSYAYLTETIWFHLVNSG